MMTPSNNRNLLLLLLSLARGGVAVCAYGHGDDGGASPTRLHDHSNAFVRIPSDASNESERVSVKSTSQPEPAPWKVGSYYVASNNTPQKRFLRRKQHNNNEKDGTGEQRSKQTTKQIKLPSKNNLSIQVWNPIRGRLAEVILNGLRSVGWWLLAWFVLMCSIGGSMRCYLCCNLMWRGRIFNPRRLYYSFADPDGEPESGFDNETEGIALDTLGEESESYQDQPGAEVDNEAGGTAVDTLGSEESESYQDQPESGFDNETGGIAVDTIESEGSESDDE